MFLLWVRAWLRVRRSLREAYPVDLQLPEIPIPVLMADSRTEPGIVGIIRPALLLPKGLLQRLSQAQAAAVVSHELCHVRRRDKKTICDVHVGLADAATILMANEAIERGAAVEYAG